MEKKDLRDLSKLVSHALRHEPAAYGLKLDADGWVALDAFIAAAGLGCAMARCNRD